MLLIDEKINESGMNGKQTRTSGVRFLSDRIWVDDSSPHLCFLSYKVYLFYIVTIA